MRATRPRDQRRGEGGPARGTEPAAPGLLGGLADAVPHLVWVADDGGVVREYSSRISGYGATRRESDDGWTWELMVHPDDLESTTAAWVAAVADQRPYEHEHRLRMADGGYRWHLSRGIRMAATDGTDSMWYGTATDVHDIRAAEDQLRQVQSALALAMRGGQMGWWQRNLATDEVTWSPELEDLFGLPPGSFAGDEDAFLRLVHADDRSNLSSAVAGAIATGRDYVVEFRFEHADGSWRWMEGRGRATYADGQATFLYGIGIDITERKETEAAIRAREERLRLAAEAGDFGLYDYDLVTGGSYWSPELHGILGWSGEAVPLVDAPLHPDDRGEVLSRFAAAEEPLGDGGFDVEFRIVRGDDGAVRWVSTHGQTFFSDSEPGTDRRPTRAVGVVLDVTERKQADELRDVFVGMLSHELRTPVTSIYGGSQVLRRGQVDEETRREIIGDIVTESERLERLVENLLVLAQAERHVALGGREPVLLRPILGQVLDDKRRRWPGRRLEVIEEPDLPPVASDEGSVELVLRNLISNAMKYGDPAGLVTLRVTRAGSEVEVCVEDDGPGVPVENPARLFDLFYRTDDARRRAQGAGIGLFVVRALVEAAGGRAWAANRSDRGGAVFGFTLPVFVESDDDAALG